jgi:hypothetical protein
MVNGPSNNELRKQIEATYQMLKAFAEIIYRAGEVPSGELYVRVMHKMSLDDYNRLIATLKRTGLVTETPGHLLRWTGPQDLNNTNNERNTHHG